MKTTKALRTIETPSAADVQFANQEPQEMAQRRADKKVAL